MGPMGKILRIDLSQHKLEITELDENVYRKLGGGSGLGVCLVFRHTPPGVDALKPQNTLVFSVSAVTGAPISGLSRMNVAAKSPLTGAIGDSQSGGFFPAQLKFTGYDALVFTGRSSSPVYLYIHDGHAEIRDASHLWGRSTARVEQMIKDELQDERVQIAQCGIAAENGVSFASIMTNANRANGRTGMGCVMASKNLKAVVVRGKQKIKIADPDKLRELSRWGVDNLKSSGSFGLHLAGTAGAVAWQDQVGGLPTHNYSSGTFAGAKNLDGQTINEQILVKRDTCYACAVRCKPVVEVRSERFPVEQIYGGPEYETVATFGSYCGIDDLHAVAYMSQLCNKYGMDTITCGATIAWAMECYENGLLTIQDLDGVDLRFGNWEGAIQMVEKIAHAEGVGAILAQGSAKAAQHFQNGTEELLITCKGQEMPAHMPQNKASLSLIYAVNPFGADHQSSEHDAAYMQATDRLQQLGLTDPQPEDSLSVEKVRFAYLTQCLYAAMDSLCACQFVYGAGWQLYGPQDLVDVVNAVTGWEITLSDLLDIGRRRLVLMRLFNCREGFTTLDDRAPQKIFRPLKGGVSDGSKVDRAAWEKALQEYYRIAGIDPDTGKPTMNSMKILDDLEFSYMLK